MKRYRCRKCGCRLDPGEGQICEDCREQLRQEASHRKQFCLTADQQEELKQMLPGVRLGEGLTES